MGGGQSTPAAPARIVEDPYPKFAGADGISLSQAVKCKDCKLGVDTKISTSSVKLVRELGDMSSAQCRSYDTDLQRVARGTLSLSEMVAKLQLGEYATPTSKNETTGESFCQMLSITPEKAAKVTSIGELQAGLDRGRIRRVANGGGYSSGTKARFIPSIPFKMNFSATQIVEVNGKKQSRPSEIQFDVTQMVLYYPSPIRIDSVQADAILSLNDPSDPAAKSIVLIPLKGVNGGDDSAMFINKIVGHVVNVHDLDKATGSYPSQDIQTGADWNLGKLFTLGKEDGKTSSIKNGFFTWTGVGEMERVLLSSNSQEIHYGWKPKSGFSAPQYFLLDTPLTINSGDLSVLTRNLPTTPPDEATHPVPANSNLVFHKDAEAPAPDTLSGRTGCGDIGNLCEGFANPIGIAREPFEGCPGAKCDPFLQNAERIGAKKTFFTARNMFAFFFNFMILVAMCFGTFIALRMVAYDYDLNLRNYSETIGKLVAVWSKNLSKLSIPSISKLRSLAQSQMARDQ